MGKNKNSLTGKIEVLKSHQISLEKAKSLYARLEAVKKIRALNPQERLLKALLEF